MVLICCSGVAVVFLDVTLSYSSTVVALKLKNQNLPVWCGGGGGGGGGVVVWWWFFYRL